MAVRRVRVIFGEKVNSEEDLWTKKGRTNALCDSHKHVTTRHNVAIGHHGLRFDFA